MGKPLKKHFNVRNDNDSLNMHHDRLQNLLGAEKKWKEIEDVRKNIGLGEAEEAELKKKRRRRASIAWRNNGCSE